MRNQQIRDSETTRSPAMQRLLRELETYAPWPMVLLLQGESGSGKTWIARRIHECSGRGDRPFEEFSLASPELELVGSELFGHVRGAYTGAVGARAGRLERAHHGTLFLDELGKCPLHIQLKLLSFLDRQTFYPIGSNRPLTVDVRLIFAASEPLADLVETGRLARDFRPRLGVVVLEVPPLRERRADIVPLARQFVADFHRRGPRGPEAPPPTMSVDLETALVEFSWPDNVRQLERVVQALVACGYGRAVLDLDLLSGRFETFRPPPPSVNAGRVERSMRAHRALEQAHGVKRRAAALMGCSLSTYYRLLGEERRATGA